MTRNFVACKQLVFNRGKAPDSFLNELVDWGMVAPAGNVPLRGVKPEARMP